MASIVTRTEVSAQRLVKFVEMLIQEQKFGNVGEREIITALIEDLTKGHIKKEGIRDWDKLKGRADKLSLNLPQGM